MTVAVMDWDSHRYLEAYFAVPMMGAVLQTVNVRLPQPQIAYTLQHANAERSEEHTSELQSLMRISYAVFCLKKKKYRKQQQSNEATKKDLARLYKQDGQR